MKQIYKTKKSARLAPASRRRAVVSASRGRSTSSRLCESRQGFTLVESLIAVFIFSLVSVMLAGTFSSFLKNYAAAKKAQRNVESAQYTMNLAAKMLRTSQITEFWLNGPQNGSCFPPVTVGCSGSNPGFSAIRAFDYSQSKCYSLVLTSDQESPNNSLLIKTPDPAVVQPTDFASCKTFPASNFVSGTAASNISAGNFYITYNGLGKITVTLNVGEAGQTSGQGATFLQSTVSFRQ